MTTFTDLGLAQPLLKALAQEGYETPTPIQAQAIPLILEGSDLLGTAQTGTGKTAAFALPILHRLAASRRMAPRKGCRALILSPTRELATQLADSFKTYGRHLGFSVAVIFGGVGAGPQIQALARGIDILVATPGRLLDHMQGGFARLDGVETFVLDEADQMLDMGFIPAIRRIVKTLPAERQNLFFSATMPPEIGKLAGELLRDPKRVSVAPVAATADRVAQHVIHVSAEDKRARLARLFGEHAFGRTIVFTRTKHGADRIVKVLEQAGIGSVAIHGNKSQPQRIKALDGFKSGRTPILIATDIAARGIDVDGVTHVINFDLPHVAEAYVHRIGRTARAGAEGIAISLCAPEDRPLLRAIEKLTRQSIPVMEGDPTRGAEPSYGTPRRSRGGAPGRHGQGQGRHHGGPREHGARHAEHRQGEHRHAEQRSGEPRADHRPRHEPRPAPGGEGLGHVGFLRPAGDAGRPEHRSEQRPHHPGQRPQQHKGPQQRNGSRRPHRGGGERRHKAG